MNDFEIICFNSKNQQIQINNIISCKFNSSINIPSDFLEFSAVIYSYITDIISIKVYSNSTLIFNGIIDTLSLEAPSDNHFILHISSRNKSSAYMLDNEVRPSTYTNVSSNDIFTRHCKPFGISSFIIPSNKILPSLNIKKGSSHWSVVDLFCKLTFQKSPFFISNNSSISLNPFNTKNHLFSTTSKTDSIPFSSATFISKRDKIISKIYVKTGSSSYGSLYNVSLDNKFAESLKIVRKRYFNYPHEWLSNPSLSAKYYVNKSLIYSNQIVLSIPFIPSISIGDSASFISSYCSLKNLYVGDISISISNKKISSTIILLDKKFII